MTTSRPEARKLAALGDPWARMEARIEAMPVGPERTQALVDMNAMLTAHTAALAAADKPTPDTLRAALKRAAAALAAVAPDLAEQGKRFAVDEATAAYNAALQGDADAPVGGLREAFEAGWLARDKAVREGTSHVGSPAGYAAEPVDPRVSHDESCCAARGCHPVCSHLCGTDLHVCDGTEHLAAATSSADAGAGGLDKLTL